ncbi:histidine kinase [Idiomarina piscisalsi]|uniref:histidine kinase n=1 Tax=Idiomarina piscisalsi TaxID=1096243 RepID=A0ABN5APQ6_9GAMM|nr:PAS domain-containing sensor histidine kinase [Idiomarina piscisalsi]ASG65878.1 histidine kinase [Idiomarina piscisalsi]
MEDIDTLNEDLDSSSFLSLVFNTIPGLAFVKNESFEIVKANTAFLNLYPDDVRDSVIGSTTVESYSKEDRDAFLHHDKIAFKDGYSETVETIFFPDGKVRTLLTKKKRFRADSGKFYILGIATDITRQEEAIRQLEESNKDLKSFTQIASHDLKAPLAAIEQVVTWINNEYASSFSPEVKAYFEIIKVRAKRLQKLLNDLLMYSTMSQVSHDYETINLKGFAKDILNMSASNGAFTLHVDDEIIRMPVKEFEIVLRNLFSNAVKHHDTGQGNIWLTVKDSNHGYLFTVADDGPGIPQKHSQNIFEMFSRLKSQDEVEGSGIGLSIVRRILEKFGGSVELAPSDKGARFEIYWPKEMAE